jgi:hypothetical protein
LEFFRVDFFILMIDFIEIKAGKIFI